ncbi:MAG: SRPBCC family protein [Actinomycetota bacterium]|nr:SRPBCC family protein [Actinomycetota bacterium]
MGTVREAIAVRLEPRRAYDLWTDVRRWPTFVDGFARPQRLDDEWPASGSKLVWQSTPEGRGTVTERVVESEPGVRLVTEVFEERCAGVQRVAFEPDAEGTLVQIEYEYELARGGPLRGVTDVLFIRRAQSDALVRTLRRFATEAAEEAAL